MVLVLKLHVNRVRYVFIKKCQTFFQIRLKFVFTAIAPDRPRLINDTHCNEYWTENCISLEWIYYLRNRLSRVNNCVEHFPLSLYNSVTKLFCCVKVFSRGYDGRYCFEKYFKLYCVLYISSNENWLAFSTNTALATKFLSNFSSTLLCFSGNSSKICCIDITFSKM